MIKVIAVGDIMPGGILSGVRTDFVSQEVLQYLHDADIRVGTLETAIGNEPNFNEEKMKRLGDVVYAKDEDLVKLKQLSLDIVSLANNHFYDLGLEGARHTIRMLDELHIKHIGAGNNLREASAPVIRVIDDKKVAFLAFCDKDKMGWCPWATETTPGINPMDDDYVVSEIRKYKKQNDFVVVMSHWGREQTWVTTPRVYKVARKMMKAGADLVLGSHPHRVHPVVNYKRASVAYSMGNFLFPDRLIVKPRSTFYPQVPVDYTSLPVTDAYPYVESMTYKKWRPLARVGMLVLSEFEGKSSHSSYKLTYEGEDGKVTMYNNGGIDSVLKRRERMLRYYTYPTVVTIEQFSNALFRKMGIKKKVY